MQPVGNQESLTPALQSLAIYGGTPVRKVPMPPRRAFGPEALNAVQAVFERAMLEGRDFGYQESLERDYTAAFIRFLGSDGFADAVCSGTAALFVALAALQLPKGSHVLVSPVTDPGTLNAIILNQLVPVLVDSMPNSYNMGPEQLETRITDNSKAVLLVHCGGKAAPVDEISKVAEKHGLYLIEDCSQAHGAVYNGHKVGTFGHLAVFSTMYCKAHSTGGCGGLVFTQDESLYRLVRAHADRGKPFWDANYNDRDPRQCLFPALNLNIDELSCAIGLSSLMKLDAVIEKRLDFIMGLQKALAEHSVICRLHAATRDDSPFFWPVEVDIDNINCTKVEFATAVEVEGISLKAHYPLMVSEWPYVQQYLYDRFECPHAQAFRDGSFNLLLNENFGEQEIADIVCAIRKVERAYAR